MMTEEMNRPATVVGVRTRRGYRDATPGVRAWTGRSAIRSATTTPRPAIATTEAGKTRVSGMRVSARTIVSLSSEGAVAPGSTASARRETGDSLLTSG